MQARSANTSLTADTHKRGTRTASLACSLWLCASVIACSSADDKKKPSNADAGADAASASRDAADAIDAQHGSKQDAGHKDSGTTPADGGEKPGNDAGPTGLASVFVAQGHKGRLTISCDDGHTWIADHSDDDTVQCFMNMGKPDCDHDPGAGRGLAFGNGYLLATFGWGEPGYIARTKNGIDWEKFTQTRPYADLAFGNGIFVANDFNPLTSKDGMTWTMGGKSVLTPGNQRAIGFVKAAGGRFVVTGETGGTHDVVLSTDDSKSWKHPMTLPAECGAAVLGIAASDSVIILAQKGGRICRSADGGETWTTQVIAQNDFSNPVWTGSEFMVWTNTAVYRSPDAQSWTMATVTPNNVRIGHVAVNKHGTFAAISAEFGKAYDMQAFYRSKDGVTWEILPKTAYKGGHPIYFMDAVELEASTMCPAQ